MSARTSARAGIGAVVVVVPAHDEEELLGRCLAGVRAAVRALGGARPHVVAHTVVVLDRCRDASADVARAGGATTVVVDAGNVGVARRCGTEHAARLTAHLPDERVWLAHTDADSAVPRDWLVQMLDQVDLGARLVVGRVHPDPADLPAATYDAWHRLHHPARAAASVHGANLGVRLDTCRAVGGMPPLAEHEDVRLVELLRAAGTPEAPGTTVTTSGRLLGRTPGGFSGYLRSLRAALEPT